jgi:glycosyltransferase involved in cell wall biosynthesis
MFVLQTALLKERGGVDTALMHYARMFDAVGVAHGALYRGAALADFRAAGIDAAEAPADLTAPLFFCTAAFRRLRAWIAERARGGPVLAIVHSDMAAPILRRLAPGARMVAPCHSDKAKRKRGVDVVVTLNPAQHELVRAILRGSRARAFLLGNPYVDQERAPPSAEGPLRLNFCARFIPAKDPMTLMRAARLAKADAPCRFIGAGPLEETLRAAAAGAPFEISFPGWRPDPFVDFTRGDVLVLPSAWEGLPYLLQEALARGVPVIASDIAGNRQALGDGAYGALFPFGDAAALASAIDAGRADLDALGAKAQNGRAQLPARYGAAPFWAALQAALNESADQRPDDV